MAQKTTIHYDVHPSVAMVQDWMKTLPTKTGKSFDQWIKLIQKEGPKELAPTRTWLKDKHNLGTNTAWWLAERALANDPGLYDDDPESYLRLAPKYVDQQYAGKKAALWPIYQRLYALGRSLGKDVQVCPCKTIVPFYRHHVFANIKPSTNTRVDLGLCLIPMMKDKKRIPERLIDTGGFAKKDRITHRIPLASVDEIDEFVEKWLRKAYDLDSAKK